MQNEIIRNQRISNSFNFNNQHFPFNKTGKNIKNLIMLFSDINNSFIRHNQQPFLSPSSFINLKNIPTPIQLFILLNNLHIILITNKFSIINNFNLIHNYYKIFERIKNLFSSKFKLNLNLNIMKVSYLLLALFVH